MAGHLPPESIQDIRRAREENQTEFGEHIGVSTSTISEWENGNATPSTTHTEAMLGLVPTGLSEDELTEPVADPEVWSDKLPPAERRLFGSKYLNELRERPRTSEELDWNLGDTTDQQRMFIQRLQTTASRGGVDRLGSEVTTVFYLEGDERRAMRRFIEANEEQVSEALSKTLNRFDSDWNDFLYGLLEEEWRFWLLQD